MNNDNLIQTGALITAVAWVCLATNAAADPVDFGDNKVPTRTIEFAESSEVDGRIARFDGIVSDDGQRLIVKGLDVMSPLVVRVLAKDVAQPVDVSLHRYFWGKADAGGSTGTQGDWEFRGRAHDEVGIALSVQEPTPVYAFVWQGPAAPAAAVPTVIVDMDRESSGAGAAESGGFDLMTLGIVGLLFVIAVLLALQLLQRRSSASAAVLALVMLAFAVTGEVAVAQSSDSQPPNPFVDEADKPPAEQQPPNPFVDEADKPPAEQQPPDPFADDQKPPGSEFKPEETADKPQSADATDGDGKIKPTPDGDKPQTADATDGDGKIKPTPDGDKPQTADSTDGDSKIKPTPDGDKPQTADGDSKIKPTPDGDKPQTADSKLKPDPDKPGDESKPKPEEGSVADSDTKPGSADSDGSSSPGDSGFGDDSSGPAGSFEDRLNAAYDDIRQLQSEVASNAARIRNLEFLINQDRDAVPEPGDGAPPISVSCDSDPACQACLRDANNDLSDLLVSLDKLRIIYVSYMRYRNYMVGLGDSISGFHQLEQAAWYQTKLQIEEATLGLQAAYDAKFDEFKGKLSDSLMTLSACNSVEGDPIFSRESVLFENYVKAKYARDD